MTTIIPELVDGHQYTDVLAGFEISRVFHISGLVDSPDRQLIEAGQDPGIPQLNDLYPGTGGIICVRRDITPNGPNAARVVCIYSARQNVSTFNQPVPITNEGQDVKQVSAGTREFETAFDISGSPMTLNPPTTPNDLSGWPSYLSKAKMLVPAGALVFERVEKSPPITALQVLVGSVNDSVLGGIYASGSLLFSGFDAVSEDGGRLWNVTYTFRYDLLGWKHIDSYHGPDGKVPLGATSEAFTVLEEADFTGLGLDFTASQTPIS